MPFDSLPPEQQRDRQRLRSQLRQARRALSPSGQRVAARGLARRLSALPGLRRARHVAAYVAADGEIDPGPFLAQAARHGTGLWLPVLSRQLSGQGIGMRFARQTAAPGLSAGTPSRRHWQRNRFGLLEPRNRTRRAAWTLDALLMPLVGFDAEGQRLGMGGGFYDRLLADLARRPRQPWLLGLAHDLQQVDRLPVAAWDRPVDAVITATRVIRRAGRCQGA